jgi:glycosyltransferase involved in cell wall biosynthesis
MRGGPTNQLMNLVKHLDSERFEAVILTLSPEPEDSHWAKLANMNVRLRSLDLSRIAGMVCGRRALQSVLGDESPDIVHSHGFRADLLVASIPLRIPSVSVVRNFPQFDYPMTYGQFVGRWMAKRHPVALAKATVCVAVSEAVNKNLRKRYGLKNVVTIPNGVDTDIFRPVDSREKIGIRHDLGLREQAEIWVACGDLIDRKDPLTLIRAFRRAPSGKQRVLLLVGGGPLERECESAIGEVDNILMVGRVPSAARYLQASDRFVSASKAEGLPNAVLEALASGLPVILSDIEPHRELLGLRPGVGALFKTGDEVELGRLFDEYRPPESVTEGCVQMVNQHLSAWRMSHRYQELYSELVSRDRTAAKH